MYNLNQNHTDKFSCNNWEDVVQYVMNTRKQFIHRNCTLDKAVGSLSIAITLKGSDGIPVYYTSNDAIQFLNESIEF